jgi:hypothetical protein
MNETKSLPEIVGLDRDFTSRTGDWKVSAPEHPREFALHTCVRYTYHFSRPPRDGGPMDERTIVVMVPKDEVWDEHRDEELREMIRSRLDFSTEAESVLNPYGCPLEDR